MYRNELVLRTNQAVRNINWLHPIYSAIIQTHIDIIMLPRNGLHCFITRISWPKIDHSN